MMKFTVVIILFCLFFHFPDNLAVAQSKQVKQDPIRLFNLDYTLERNIDGPEDLHLAWDHVHTVATLQGIVNRDSPRLYVFFVENQSINIDRYWWKNTGNRENGLTSGIR